MLVKQLSSFLSNSIIILVKGCLFTIYIPCSFYLPSTSILLGFLLYVYLISVRFLSFLLRFPFFFLDFLHFRFVCFFSLNLQWILMVLWLGGAHYLLGKYQISLQQMSDDRRKADHFHLIVVSSWSYCRLHLIWCFIVHFSITIVISFLFYSIQFLLNDVLFVLK